MNPRTLKFLTISITVFTILYFLLIPSGFAQAGLVPCGTSETQPCTVCHTFELGKNIIDFYLNTAMPLAATFLFFFAGFFLLTSAGKSDRVGKAQKIFTTTIWGIVISLSAWLVVNTILRSLAGDSNAASEWYRIECKVNPKSGKTQPLEKVWACVAADNKYACSPGNKQDLSDVENNACQGKQAVQIDKSLCGKEPPTQVSGNAQELARQILDKSSKVQLAGNHSSGNNDNATARQNIVDTAEGRQAQRSSYGCAPGQTVALNTKMLAGVLKLSDSFSFSVSEIAGGQHSCPSTRSPSGSRHYSGLAFDANVINGQSATASNSAIRQFSAMCRTLGATEVFDAHTRPQDHGTHVHCAWPR